MKRFALDGKTVAITGGARGLGLAIAREAARRGAKLGLFARSEEELSAARAEFAIAGVTVSTAVCDVRNAADVATTLDSFARELGPIDALFNVAGVISVGPVGALSLDDYRDAIETNFLGAVYAIEAVRPSMQARHSGRIVNITSLGGKVGIPHMLPYCASKYALIGYSAALRAELQRDGIRVVSIIPGLMRTGSPPHATFAGQPRKEYVTFALSDSLPFLSVDVRYAARLIVDACERGTAEKIVGWQAKVAIAAATVAPRAVENVLGFVNRFVPGPGNGEHRSGFASESPITQSFLTKLGRNASAEQNELVDLPQV
jgi:NAD(P)-dependent dehydrogenase (short-subunit alcohol dehydrogenase family)